MCRAFQPFTMQGIYFSLCASTQIKISPFHLRLLQSRHIPREKNPCLRQEKQFINDNVNLNDNNNFSAEVFLRSRVFL